MPVYVRLSRGHFDAGKFDEIERRLTESQKTLIPAIRKLDGCLHYYAGIDRTSNAMINVSVWDTLEHATQMASLKEMLALAEEFRAIGVRFEPIVNYRSVWDIKG